MSNDTYDYRRCEDHTKTLATLEEHARGVNGQIKSIQVDVREIRKTLDEVRTQQKLWSGGLAVLVIAVPLAINIIAHR